jgi:hypothetical protein
MIFIYNGAKWQERMYSEENIACEFAIFFNGLMPMNCKEIMRRQDLPNEEKVKLVFTGLVMILLESHFGIKN